MKYKLFFTLFLISAVTLAQQTIIGKYELVPPQVIQVRQQDPNNYGTVTIRETLLNTGGKIYKLYRIKKPTTKTEGEGQQQRQQFYNAFIPQNENYKNLYVKVEGDIDEDNLIIYSVKIKHIYTEEEIIKTIENN